MAFPVFAAQSNPTVDRPICRKKRAYCDALVSSGHADWLNPSDRRYGLVLRKKYLDLREDTIAMIAGSGFDSAWAKLQSGYAGPLVWQLKTTKSSEISAS